MVFIGFIAQIILIILIVNAASNRPNSTAGQRWGIGIAVVVLTKAVGFGLGLVILAALPAFGIPVNENNIGVISLMADIPLGIIIVTAGYFIAKAAYDRICGPKAYDAPSHDAPSRWSDDDADLESFSLVGIVSDVVAVLVLAIMLPVVLVLSVLLAVYGDIAKTRNRWTGLELPDMPS